MPQASGRAPHVFKEHRKHRSLFANGSVRGRALFWGSADLRPPGSSWSCAAPEPVAGTPEISCT